MKSAAELIAISEGKAQVAREQRAQTLATEAAQAEATVLRHLNRMRQVMTEKAPQEAARHLGYIVVFDMAGDFTAEGSGNEKRDYYGPAFWPGLEEAWGRLKAELAPLGYRFARTVHTINTGSYDSPYEDRTNFVVEWAAPWVTNGRR